MTSTLVTVAATPNFPVHSGAQNNSNVQSSKQNSSSGITSSASASANSDNSTNNSSGGGNKTPRTTAPTAPVAGPLGASAGTPRAMAPMVLVSVAAEAHDVALGHPPLSHAQGDHASSQPGTVAVDGEPVSATAAALIAAHRAQLAAASKGSKGSSRSSSDTTNVGGNSARRVVAPGLAVTTTAANVSGRLNANATLMPFRSRYTMMPPAPANSVNNSGNAMANQSDAKTTEQQQGSLSAKSALNVNPAKSIFASPKLAALAALGSASSGNGNFGSTSTILPLSSPNANDEASNAEIGTTSHGVHTETAARPPLLTAAGGANAGAGVTAGAGSGVLHSALRRQPNKPPASDTVTAVTVAAASAGVADAPATFSGMHHDENADGERQSVATLGGLMGHGLFADSAAQEEQYLDRNHQHNNGMLLSDMFSGSAHVGARHGNDSAESGAGCGFESVEYDSLDMALASAYPVPPAAHSPAYSCSLFPSNGLAGATGSIAASGSRSSVLLAAASASLHARPTPAKPKASSLLPTTAAATPARPAAGSAATATRQRSAKKPDNDASSEVKGPDAAVAPEAVKELSDATAHGDAQSKVAGGSVKSDAKGKATESSAVDAASLTVDHGPVVPYRSANASHGHSARDKSTHSHGVEHQKDQDQHHPQAKPRTRTSAAVALPEAAAEISLNDLLLPDFAPATLSPAEAAAAAAAARAYGPKRGRGASTLPSATKGASAASQTRVAGASALDRNAELGQDGGKIKSRNVSPLSSSKSTRALLPMRGPLLLQFPKTEPTTVTAPDAVAKSWATANNNAQRQAADTDNHGADGTCEDEAVGKHSTFLRANAAKFSYAFQQQRSSPAKAPANSGASTSTATAIKPSVAAAAAAAAKADCGRPRRRQSAILAGPQSGWGADMALDFSQFKAPPPEEPASVADAAPVADAAAISPVAVTDVAADSKATGVTDAANDSATSKRAVGTTSGAFAFYQNQAATLSAQRTSGATHRLLRGPHVAVAPMTVGAAQLGLGPTPAAANGLSPYNYKYQQAVAPAGTAGQQRKNK